MTCLLSVLTMYAQVPIDTLPALQRDSVPNRFTDSTVVSLKQIKFSSQSFDDEVKYAAKDSMWFDVKNKRLHLYGQASVIYTSLNIKAGYILLDYNINEISAEQFADTSGQLVGLPEFEDGDQKFKADKLRYNFKTKKGIIYQTRTTQEDLYVISERAKFIGSATQDTSSRSSNTIYNENAILTTCNAVHPHFGIHTQKLKVVPDKVVVTGFSNVEIGGIPTPLVLPFGFFPISKTRKAGLIIPRDFEFADREGLGIKEFGWYQPISDHIDAKVLLNAYTSGSWGIQGTLRYDDKYRFNGDFDLHFNNRVSEGPKAEKIRFNSFGLKWGHRQAAKAHPTRTFGGSINIETNRDQNRNRNDYQSVYQNTLSSNMTYSKRFPGRPYQFSAALNHSQNTQTRLMTISLPNLNFTMQRIFPFKRKLQEGAERWYEKISLTYNSQLQNTFNAVDTTLFSRKTLETSRAGVRHQANTDYNFKLFKYLNIAPSISYEENWYPYTVEKKLLPTRLAYDSVFQREGTSETFVGLAVDSLRSRFNQDTTIRNWGFSAYRTFRAGLSVNTALFLTKQYRHGWFRGIRHTMKPSASIGFAPDFTNARWSRYFGTYYSDNRPGRGVDRTYSIYDDGIYGRPTYSPQSMILGYSISNVLEFKHYSARKDTVLRKRIFDGLTFSGSYNLSADTLKWSDISTGGVFRFFKGVTNLNWDVAFSPYINDAQGRAINKFAINEEGRLLRTTRFGIRITSNLTLGQLRTIFSKKDDGGTKTKNTAKPDDLLSWFETFRVSHNIAFVRQLLPTGYGTVKDTFFLSLNNVSLSGDIPLTGSWKLGFGNIAYDFQVKRIVYPDLRIIRDLHCWEMSLGWQPTRGTYLFSLYVKPGSLDFLKIPYRKNNLDAQVQF